MKWLFTGGTGFFGEALLRHWQAAHNPPEIWVLSRNPERFLAVHPEVAVLPWLRFARGDIAHATSLPQGERFSHVLHAAADSTLGPTLAPLEQYDQIVNGTRNLLEFALRSGASRFLFISSGAVYGRQPADLPWFPETWLGMPDPLVPGNAYGVGKRAAEHLCSLYNQAHDLQSIVARCFAFVGPDLPLNVHFAIGNFIRDALWSDEIIVNGDGTPIRSYLDQRDLAHWLMSLLRDGKAGEAYNVGSDRVISIADLAHLVRDLVSPEKPVRILGKPVDNAERSRYVPDISKIHKHLGLRPTYTLEQSILDTAAAARARGRPS